ncbi:MAG: phosphate ABC transporter substrate-binding protein [Gammaproteobacteria bacterium]
MGSPISTKLTAIGVAACFAMTGSDANVVTVVSAKSPITALSKEQIADIFLGKSYRFPEGASATPIDQPEGSSVRGEFYDKVTGKSLAQLKAYWSKIIFTGRGRPPKAASSSAEVKKMLAADLSAISYIDDTQVDPSIRVLSAD